MISVFDLMDQEDLEQECSYLKVVKLSDLTVDFMREDVKSAFKLQMGPTKRSQVVVDMGTRNLLVQIHDMLSPEMQPKYRAQIQRPSGFEKARSFAWKNATFGH